MFTGIIETIGKVKEITPGRGVKKLEIMASDFFNDVKIGDSVAVDGVCLTAAHISKDRGQFDVMSETISKTTLKDIKPGMNVNLEKALKAGSPVGGHFVYGHIDGVRQIINISGGKETRAMDISITEDDAKYIVEKGSIAIDGISLTVGKVTERSVRLFLIPHTLKSTTLMNKKPRDFVNVEFDMTAKYIYKQKQSTTAITESYLRDKGFI